MKNKFLITLAFILIIVSFLAQSLQAQRLISGNTPAEFYLKGFDDSFCVHLKDRFQVCKAAKYESEETKYIILKDTKILTMIDAPHYNSACCEMKDFFAFRGDLDKDNSPEIVIASLEGVSNGIAISYYNIYIFRDPTKFAFEKPLIFPIEEFGKHGNFIFDKRHNETLILLTYWNWYENLDPKRGNGLYLVGKWFRYRKGLLNPVFDKPTLARRFLDSFAKARGNTYNTPNFPYQWLKSKNTDQIFVEPTENAKLIGTKAGIIKDFKDGEFTIQTDSNEIVNYSLGCCPTNYNQTYRLTISEFGILPQKFTYPNHFPDGFSPLIVFKKIAGKKVLMETYRTDYDLQYIKLWFLEE